MPTNDGIWLDYDESLFPSRPEAEEGDPEDAIEWRDLELRPLLRVCGELLAKSEFDDYLLTVASDEARSTTHHEC